MSEAEGMTCPVCEEGALTCYLRHDPPRLRDGVTGSYRCSHCTTTFAYAPDPVLESPAEITPPNESPTP